MARRLTVYPTNMNMLQYRCPASGQQIEAWLVDDEPPPLLLTPDCGYQLVICPACHQRHVVDRDAGLPVQAEP